MFKWRRPMAAPASAKIIGQVTKLSGTATAIRNGVSIILNQGDNVHQGDVVQSGSNSTVGITFIDGSVFGLGPSAKMVLNEMIYDPNGSNNSSLVSLVAGTISFVAGATAKHGDMKVDTPVATMGIRGTAVLVEIDFVIQQPTTPLSVQPRNAGPIPDSGRARRHQRVLRAARQGHAGADRDRQPARNHHDRQRPGHRHVPADRNTVGRCATHHQRSVRAEVHRQHQHRRSNTNFTDTIIPFSTAPIKITSGELVTPIVFTRQRTGQFDPGVEVGQAGSRAHRSGA